MSARDDWLRGEHRLADRHGYSLKIKRLNLLEQYRNNAPIPVLSQLVKGLAQINATSREG